MAAAAGSVSYTSTYGFHLSMVTTDSVEVKFSGVFKTDLCDIHTHWFELDQAHVQDQDVDVAAALASHAQQVFHHVLSEGSMGDVLPLLDNLYTKLIETRDSSTCKSVTDLCKTHLKTLTSYINPSRRDP